MMNSNNKVTISIAILLVGFSIILALLVAANNEPNKKYEKRDIKTVNDYNTFLAIQNAANKFLGTYDKTEINKLLDSVDGTKDLKYNTTDYSIKANQIEYIKMQKNYAYYITGKILKSSYDKIELIENNYNMIIYYDYTNMTMSVIPRASDFLGVINKKKKIDIKQNDVNQIPPSRIYKEYDICSMYFNDFMNSLIIDVDDAYEHLNETSLKRFSNLLAFEKYVNNNIANYSFSINNCKKLDNKYIITDKNSNKFTIIVDGIMNYAVELNS